MIIQDAASITWKIPRPARPSIQRSVETLRAETTGVKPFPRGVPLQLSITYRVGGSAWRKRGDKNSAALFHLAAPSAVSLAALCADAVTRAGVAEPGQLVQSVTTKITHDRGDSFLTVRLERLFAACVEDTDKLSYRVAAWYLAQAQATGRSTSYRGYRKVLQLIKENAVPK